MCVLSAKDWGILLDRKVVDLVNEDVAKEEDVEEAIEPIHWQKDEEKSSL